MTRFMMICVLTPCLLLLACARPPARQGLPDGGANDSSTSFCGDHVVDSGETCDDGNLLDGDGCAPDCTLEPGWECVGSPSVCTSLCGNDVLDNGEDCDGANLNGMDCTTVVGGYTGGTLGCSGGCNFDTIGCALASCGNATVDPGEECDDGNTSNDDGCMNNCQSAQCGDGYTHSGVEPCDDGNSSNTDACLVGCVSATCGDGHLWSGSETCDDSNTTAGDGCSPTCAVEALPVLHWATGQPAVWDEMTLYYAGEPHAPTAPIVAAANTDQRDRAYLFTTTTYHVLSLPGHQWLESGSISSRFSGVPSTYLIFGWGVSWSTQPSSSVVFAVDEPGIGVRAYTYDINNATGAVTPNAANPNLVNWSSHTDPPVAADVKAGYCDLANANGWMSGDPSAICGGSNTSIGPNLGGITTANQFYTYDAGACFEFYDHMPVSQFPPFGVSGAPAASEIVAAFYSSEHGNRLYVVTIP